MNLGQLKPDWKSPDGNVALFRGDCTEITPKLPKGLVNTVITDPPYGMAFQARRKSLTRKRVAGDKTPELLRWAVDWAVANAKHSAYVFGRWNNLDDIPAPESFITWVKNNWSQGNTQHAHARQTEGLFFYPLSEHDWANGRPTDVVFASRVSRPVHPTEKPLLLMFQVVSWTRGLVFDPFMGSGTTGVACVMNGRPFIGIEKDPEHFRMALDRVRRAALEKSR